MEHSKSKMFHFTWSQNPLKPPSGLTLVGGPILIPKLIWYYLGFYFDVKDRKVEDRGTEEQSNR